MTKKELEQRIENLRTEYESATNERRKIIIQEAKDAKALLSSLCYQCRENAMTVIHLPFCSAPCHEEWAKKEYDEPKRHEQKSVGYMTRRLKEMGKEAKV